MKKVLFTLRAKLEDYNLKIYDKKGSLHMELSDLQIETFSIDLRSDSEASPSHIEIILFRVDKE